MSQLLLNHGGLLHVPAIHGGLVSLLELGIAQVCNDGLLVLFAGHPSISVTIGLHQTAFFGEQPAHAVQAHACASNLPQHTARSLIHRHRRRRTGGSATQQIRHEAQLFIRVVQLVLEVLICNVQRTLCGLLLESAKLSLCAKITTECAFGGLEGRLQSTLLDIAHLLGKIALTLCTLDGITIATECSSTCGLALLLCAHDVGLTGGFTLLNVHHALHVGRHVTLNGLPICLGRRNTAHRRLLQIG